MPDEWCWCAARIGGGPAENCYSGCSADGFGGWKGSGKQRIVLSFNVVNPETTRLGSGRGWAEEVAQAVPKTTPSQRLVGRTHKNKKAKSPGLLHEPIC